MDALDAGAALPVTRATDAVVVVAEPAPTVPEAETPAPDVSAVAVVAVVKTTCGTVTAVVTVEVEDT